ncbi:MAG: subclass B1 metallo-beta-lactamase [Pseudomonadota bacterium]|nr:subclass B1 metallo-beta-lactamase [Pseudomonadota bacterium]
MKARYGFIVLAATLLGCATQTPRPVSADELIRVSEDLQIRQIDPDVWVHTSWHVLSDGRRLSSNGLIVRDGKQLLLIDTAWGVAPTQELTDWIARDLRLPIARLIPTHHHDDRIGGWPVLAALGVPLLATPQTLSLSASADITQTLDPALTTLSENQTVVIGAVEVFAPGPAHSPDNLMVWLPRQAILFGGCAVKAVDATQLGNIDEADFRGWPLAIQRAQQRYAQARVVVPGHGEPGDRALLGHTLDLLKAETPAE